MFRGTDKHGPIVQKGPVVKLGSFGGRKLAPLRLDPPITVLQTKRILISASSQQSFTEQFDRPVTAGSTILVTCLDDQGLWLSCVAQDPNTGLPNCVDTQGNTYEQQFNTGIGGGGFYPTSSLTSFIAQNCAAGVTGWTFWLNNIGYYWQNSEESQCILIQEIAGLGDLDTLNSGMAETAYPGPTPNSADLTTSKDGDIVVITAINNTTPEGISPAAGVTLIDKSPTSFPSNLDETGPTTDLLVGYAVAGPAGAFHLDAVAVAAMPQFGQAFAFFALPVPPPTPALPRIGPLSMDNIIPHN